MITRINKRMIWPGTTVYSQLENIYFNIHIRVSDVTCIAKIIRGTNLNEITIKTREE